MPITLTRIAVVALLLVTASGSRALAQSLEPLKTKAEQDILAELPPDVGGELIELAAQSEKWKGQIDAVRKSIAGYQDEVAAAKKSVDDLKDRLSAEQAKTMAIVDELRAARKLDPKAVQAVLDLIKPLAEKSPKVKELVRYAEVVEAKVKSIEDQIKLQIDEKVRVAQTQVTALKADAEALKARGEAYRTDVEALAALDEAQLRSAAEQAIRAKLNDELMAALGKEFTDRVQMLKNPAKFAKGFADGKFQEWLKEPTYLDDDKKFKLRVMTEKPNVSLFSPKTDLEVEVAYEGGLKVRASGFRLRYSDKAPYFQAEYTGLVVKPDAKSALDAVAGKALGSLGDLIPAGLKMPVSLGNFQLPDFKNGGVLRADIIIDLKDPMPLKGTGKVAFTPDGKVSTEGAVKFVYTPPTPQPVGTTGLAVHIVDGTFDLEAKEKTLKVGVTLAAAAPGSDRSLAFIVDVTVNFPISTIKVEGKLMIGKVTTLGEVSGTLGKLPSGQQGFDLTIRVPGDGPGAAQLKAIFSGEGRITITKERIAADGRMTLYNAFNADFSLIFNADGSGHLAGHSKLDALGVDSSTEITARFDAGFKNLVLEANFNVSIDLSKYGDLLQADFVSVHMLVKDGRVIATAHGFGVTVKVEMDVRGDLPKKLAEEFGSGLKNLVQAISDGLAQCDPFAKGSFANQLGKDLDPFSKNGFAGRYIKELENVQKLIPNIKFDPAKVGAQIGVEAGKVTEGAKQIFHKGAEGVSEGANKACKFFNKHCYNDLGDPFPDLYKRAILVCLVIYYNQENPEGDFVTRLGGAVHSLQDIELNQAIDPVSSRSPAGRTSRESQVHVRVLAPALKMIDKDTVLIGFTVKVSGSAHTLKPGVAAERLTGSQVAGGSIVLKKTGDKWKGRINQPKIDWAKVCYQDLSLELSQQIEHRVESVPGVEVEGLRLFYESALTVTNTTKTELNVRLLRDTIENSPKTFGWRPAAPGLANASEFKLKPGESKLVTRSMTGGAGDEAATAGRVRVWAETEDGEELTPYRDKDYWLVAENPKMDGRRVYQAEVPQQAEYTFTAPTGVRTYSERLVAFKNETDKPVLVEVTCLHTVDNQTSWLSPVRFSVKPNETLRPRDSQGVLMRASAMKFVAVGEHFAYRDHADKPLPLVAEAEGRRLYQGEKVGTYVHTLKPAAVTQPGGGK